MENRDLNARIIAKGKEFFETVAGEKPSLFNKGAWMGKVMDWSMQNEQFKIQMFRFVDVFPSLATGRLLTEHIREYFGRGEGYATGFVNRSQGRRYARLTRRRGAEQGHLC